MSDILKNKDVVLCPVNDVFMEIKLFGRRIKNGYHKKL